MLGWPNWWRYDGDFHRPGNSWRYRLAKKLILTRVHAALGLERAARGGSLGGVYSSAAPLSVQTFHYFQVARRLHLPRLSTCLSWSSWAAPRPRGP